MKKRILFAAILGILLVSSLSFSQEAAPPKSPAKQQPVDPNSIESELVTEIVNLKHFPTNELSRLIHDIYRYRMRNVYLYPDQRTNRIVIRTTKEQMNSILDLIAQLDVADSGLATAREALSVISRIYMFEIPSKDVDMKPFSMILQTTGQFSSKALLKIPNDKNLQISGFHPLSDPRYREREEEQKNDILIQGKAASNESITQIFDSVPECSIKELKWDNNEAFTNNIAAAQYTQLPDQLQKHIRKFLGPDIQTVGYWFGNSSVPGRVEAPMGPWKLNFSLERKDRDIELQIEVEVVEKMSNMFQRLGRFRDDILSNTITVKIGKPIIIGYNRESYGTRKMGAMVIFLEEDVFQLSVPETNPR
jgi:hypothetical protein